MAYLNRNSFTSQPLTIIFAIFFIAEELLTKYHIKYYSHQPLQQAETLTPPPFIGETIN